MTGIIFDIKEMSLHDGPGTRVTVFFKGCPLRCVWCHNPEGLKKETELMVKVAQCEHCGRCMKPCAHLECMPFERCLLACPKGLVGVAGKLVETKTLSQQLRKYKDFLNMNGGGITLSGGEPLMQPEFAVELLQNLRGFHRAIQTSGYAESEVFKKVIENLDYVMMDIKLADPVLHKKYTGVDNVKILKNYQILKSSGIPYVIRIPLIPGITDTSENLKAISKIAQDSPIELLRYNTFAGAKYPMVNKKYTVKETKNNEVDITIFQNGKML